ncbi:MAG: hypothetical protein IKO54_08750 [Lachnospiraceae bacterium]|nr:hypothetical protein [Lachnospiraceae bacterium]
MTVQELSQVYHLNREIEAYKRRLDKLKAKIGASTPKLSEMPHNPSQTDSQTEQIAADIVDTEAIIKALQIQCIHERSRLTRYIDKIQDSEIRMIFLLRFIDGLSWDMVAAEMGEGYRVEAIKKRCYRYIKRHGDRHGKRQRGKQ